MFATIKLYTFHNKIELMNEFFYLDKNKDGKIQRAELIDGLSNIFKMEIEEA
jgi:Ca2+-binding EF-hand superfamily protein